MSVRRILAIIWSIVAFLVMLWGWIAFAGPYRWAAEWQVENFGSYQEKITLFGPLMVLDRGELVASPSFALDGKTIAYLAPDSPGGGFQLWTVSAFPSTAPKPQAISSALDLDAQSAPVWIS